MLMDMDMSYEEVLEHFKPYITRVEEENKIIIMQDAPAWFSYCKESDLVCVFDDKGEMVVLTERLYRSEISFFNWIKFKLMARRLREEDVVGRGTDISVVFDKGAVNVTKYKVWWMQWIEELKQPGLF